MRDSNDIVDCRHFKKSVTCHGITADCYPYCDIDEKVCRVYEYGERGECEKRERKGAAK